jgi:hypothetical protein
VGTVRVGYVLSMQQQISRSLWVKKRRNVIRSCSGSHVHLFHFAAYGDHRTYVQVNLQALLTVCVANMSHSVKPDFERMSGTLEF